MTFYSREHPLESVAIEESASAEWAARVQRSDHPEVADLYRQHHREVRPIVDWVKSAGELEPTGVPGGEDVTESIRAEARRLGYGEVGFTRFDRHYVYQSRRPALRSDLPHAICLALEQDYEATQALPGVEAEQAQGDTYLRQGRLAMELVDYIRSLGYRCQVSGPAWQFGPMIPMFVAAGLGQLGSNGQLLSPHFGSRARLQIILTNAKITHDGPVDYGIHNFCRVCQVCVNRCPGRALTGQQLWHRGVEKAKLIFKRCRPVMTRFSGCGVCMKVCPVQRYGMRSVMEHYIETGKVLGKGTENLEGYSLPGKGYFGLRRLPQFNAAFFEMPEGRSEDRLLADFKERLSKTDGQEADEKERLWDEFRRGLDDALQGGNAPADMGMDVTE